MVRNYIFYTFFPKVIFEWKPYMGNIVCKTWKVEIKKNCYWNCWSSPSNRPNQQMKQHPTRWRYPLINYFVLGMTTECSIWHWGSTTSKSGKIRRFDDELFWESYNAQCYIFRKTYPSHIFKTGLQNCFAIFLLTFSKTI